MKGKGGKESYSHLNAEFQKIARRVKKAFLSDQCKEIEKHNNLRNTDDTSLMTESKELKSCLMKVKKLA